MSETTDELYESMIDDARDCDDDPAKVVVTASPSDFGTDIELRVTAWGSTATAYLTPEQAGALIDTLTSAIGYATARPDGDD